MSDIFVFGSNLAGRHGRGAALHARRHYDAELGVGEGPTGRAYALPTKDSVLCTLPLDAIAASIDRFILYATQHPQDQFFVTRIGCGLAGYTDTDIAPLFACAIPLPNVDLPIGWL